MWSAYRGWWKHYTPPLRWTRLLRSERDNCPYCGIALPDTTADRKQLRTVVDHMDPLELGGEDSLRNVVCCCSRCNSRKKDRLFLDWLQKLDEPFRTRACEIYQFKHQHLPDAFRIENFSMRIEGTPLFLELNAAEFRRELRRLLPLQDGPPTLYLFDMMKPHPGPVDIESMICSDRSPP
ncbi:MAG: HNH endonuclease [Betaproteobacteria bacterium]|nr:HNH endonuclease [Betaproteobacteria bacterium]